jgi:hypothetical protein
MSLTYDEFVLHQASQIRAAYAKKNGHDTLNEMDLAHCNWRRLVDHWTHRDVIHDILGEALEDGGPGGDAPTPPPPPPAPSIVPLRADGRIFRQGDAPFRWKGVSAFRLLDRFAKGENIQPFLDAYAGYNLLRVWPYVPVADWGAAAWDSQPAPVVVDFLRTVGAKGWYVELTLLTDDKPDRYEQAAQLVNVLAGERANLPNLLIEIGNEPKVHKDINTRLLKGRWTRPASSTRAGTPAWTPSGRT